MKICNKCGEEFKGVRCKPCARIASVVYYASHKESRKIKRAGLYSKNKDIEKSRSSLYYKKNKNHVIARVLDWKSNNSLRVKETSAIWQKNNPDKCVISVQNRRAKQKSSGGKLSNGLKDKLFKLQRGLCACCINQLNTSFHLDHIMPLALGGSNSDDNIQLLCKTCNQKKSSKHPIDFMQSRGYLL